MFEAHGSECATAAQTSCFAKREVCVYFPCLCLRLVRTDAYLEKAQMSRMLGAEGPEFGLVLSEMQNPAFK